MNFGSPFSAGLGTPSKYIHAECTSSRNGTAVSCDITPMTGYGDKWFGVYLNSRYSTAVQVPEGSTRRITIPVDRSTGNSSVVVLPHGNIGHIDLAQVARIYDVASDKATIMFDWPSTVFSVSGDGGLTTWSIPAGDYVYCDSIAITRATLNATMTLSGGTVTVELRNSSGTLVSSGSGSNGSTITLSGLINGTVSGTLTGSISPTLTLSWPRAMTVERTKTTTWVKAGIVRFDGSSTGSFSEKAPLSSGTWHYRLTATSDTGAVGTPCTPFDVTIPVIPAPPTGVDYLDGTIPSPRVKFTPSTTAGATYNVYVKRPTDDHMDTTVPTQTASSSPITLSGIVNGITQVLVRAVKGGVEEQNGNILFLEFLDGVYISPRPNTPTVGMITVTNGNQVSVQASYDPTDSRKVANYLQLFVRLPGHDYDIYHPDQSLGIGGGTKAARTFSQAVSGSDGVRYCVVASKSQDGQLSDFSVERSFTISTTTSMQALTPRAMNTNG